MVDARSPLTRADPVPGRVRVPRMAMRVLALVYIYIYVWLSGTADSTSIPHRLLRTAWRWQKTKKSLGHLATTSQNIIIIQHLVVTFVIFGPSGDAHDFQKLSSLIDFGSTKMDQVSDH